MVDELTTVALAAAQPTAVGREIHALHVHAGKLWPSYGDYGANTGPIHAVSVDPVSGAAVDELTMSTEETFTMRTLDDDRLAVPYCDLVGYGDPSVGALALRALDGTWRVIRSVTDHPPIHCFGVRVVAGRMWLFGGVDVEGAQSAAAAWRSDDDGVTWAFELVAASTTSGFTRIYTSDVIGGRLTVWVHDPFDFAVTGRYQRSDDGVWSKVDGSSVERSYSATIGGAPVTWTLADGPSSGQAQSSTPQVIGGVTTGTDPCYDLAVDADPSVVYGLGVDGAIYRWTDGVGETLGSVDPGLGARSVTVDDGKLFFGATDSRILVATLPV